MKIMWTMLLMMTLATACASLPSDNAQKETSAKMENPFDLPGHWYRANLHTHTTKSDGKMTLEQIAGQYREAGYDILAITDHEKTSDVASLCTPDYLLISGMETHPAWKDGMAYHIVCLNVPVGFDLSKEATPQDRIRRVREAGGVTLIAHPYWCGMALNQIDDMQGTSGMEIYNNSCGEYTNTSVYWDMALNAGRHIPSVVAVDDEHGKASCSGWTMIKATELTTEAVLDALRRGACYASGGPVIEDFRLKDGKAIVKCSPAAKLRFLMTAPHARAIVAPAGKPLTEGSCDVPKGVRYVRVEVIDADGKIAWSNPLYL